MHHTLLNSVRILRVRANYHMNVLECSFLCHNLQGKSFVYDMNNLAWANAVMRRERESGNDRVVHCLGLYTSLDSEEVASPSAVVAVQASFAQRVRLCKLLRGCADVAQPHKREGASYRMFLTCLVATLTRSSVMLRHGVSSWCI
jgi:hypothetical protein